MPLGQDPLFDAPVSEVPSVLHRPHSRKGTALFRPPVEADLFPETLGSRFKENDPVRVLLRALESVDLTPVLRGYAHRGGAPYHPLNLLAVVLFGMSKGIRSSRALEEACRYDVRFMYLMGGHEPDDRTFGRFIERLDGVIDEIYAEVMRGTSPKGRLALVDGKKVAANASWWRFRENDEITDPDALIQKSHGRFLLGYNAQVVMDEATGLVIAGEVCTSQDDSYVMEKVLTALDRQSQALPTAMVADAGYDTESSIVALEARGIDSVIACQKPPASSLKEDEDGHVVCPAGRVLQPRGKPSVNHGVLYIALRPGCRGCALADSCAFKGKTLTVPVGKDPAARFRNRDRVESAAYEDALRKRRKVERVFAQMIHDGFRAFQRRGKGKVRTEFLLWLLSYNLRTALELIFEILCRFYRHCRGAITKLAHHNTVWYRIDIKTTQAATL